MVIGIRQTVDRSRDAEVSATLVADDLRPDRRLSLIERLESAGFTVYGGWSKDELGAVAGRAAVAALTLTDRNIVAGVKELLGAARVNVEQDRIRKESNRG